MLDPPRPGIRPPLTLASLRNLVRRSRRLRGLALVALAVAAGLTVDAAIARADRARAAWEPAVTVWVTRTDVDAGSPLGGAVVGPVALPPAAVPADAVTDDPTGARTTVDLGIGEIIRTGRLRRAAGATAARLPAGTGAIRLLAPAPHLVPGDLVDLHDLLTGRRLSRAATVLDLVEDLPVVAVDDGDREGVVAAFTTGDVVPVLVG